MSKLYEFASVYLSSGYSVVPCADNKRPTIKWKDLMDAPIQQEEIEKAFENATKIGIACGPVSEGLYCLDFDCHGGQDIESVFRSFQDTSIYKWLIERNCISVYITPSRGYHIWFLCNELDVAGSVFARHADNEAMIELRGNGQYALAYPSQDYRFIAGVDLEVLTQINESLAQSIIGTAKTFDKGTIVPKSVDNANRLWPESWEVKTPEGRYNEECEAESVELLLSVGWQHRMRRDGVYEMVRPNKDWKEGISATYGMRPKMFYVFSSNAQPFMQNSAYSPFGIYALLKHNGDFKAAKLELANRFGMIKTEPEKQIEIDPNKFPVDVFPEALMYTALEVAEKLNYHLDFVCASMISAFGGVAGNKYKLKIAHGWNASPLFWFALVGSPGSKKSPPLKTMFEPIDSMDNQNVKIFQQAMKEYDSLPDNKKGKKPLLKQVIIKDSTVEALQQAHGFNSRGLIYYKDELISFFDDMNRYQAKDESFWLTSFGNSSVKVQRKTSDMVFVESCHINVIGTIQPDVIRKLNQKKSDDGMFDRFLFTSANTKFEGIRLREDPDVPMLQIWDRMIKSLEQKSNYIDKDDCVVIPIPANCIPAYNSFADELEELVAKEEKANANYYGKIQTYFPRFIILLALMDWMDSFKEIQVNESHVERAKRLCRYFMDTYKTLTSDMDAIEEVRDIVQQMRKKGKERNDIVLELSIRGYKGKMIASAVGINAATVSRILKGATDGK
jgi:hypothetical protein